MILEGIMGAGLTYTAYRRVFHKSIAKRKVRKKAKEKWQLLMFGLGKSESTNGMLQEYELLEIFVKHYGFDAIVSIPSGKKYLDLLNLIPDLEVGFKANVMLNPTEDKVTAYMRVHYVDQEISPKDNLRFKWFKTFFNIEGCTTKTGETITIDKMEEVKSPYNEVVGFKVISKIPIGLNYDKVTNSYEVISKTLGKCNFNFNPKTMELETTIIHTPITDSYKFSPIDVKPWQVYIAMGYNWQPIILDYSQNANSLIGGIQGSGKTNALMGGFINLCCKCNGNGYEDSFDLMICNMGEKNDLRIFRDVKQCKFYANNEIEVLSMLKYLKKEMNRRNKLFSSRKEFCFNIHQYNKLVPKEEQLKTIHLLGDEIADFMESEEIQELLWDIIRKSRSSGIYITVATQRGSLANMSSEIKGQLANKISFSQPNTASALTIMSGEDVAKKVMGLEKKRECLIDWAEGLTIAKTLYLDERMMEDLLRDIIVDDPNNKLIIDTNGEIVIPKTPENDEKVNKNSEKVAKNSQKVEENSKKAYRFGSFVNKNTDNKDNNKKNNKNIKNVNNRKDSNKKGDNKK